MDVPDKPVAVFTQKHRKNTPWYKCQNCQTYFTPPYEKPEEETAHSRKFAYGNMHSGIEIGNSKQKLFGKILKIIDQKLKGTGKILDHGSAYGAFSFMAKKKGYDVMAMDILPEAIEYINKNGVIGEVANSVSATQKISKSTFNAVVAVDSCYYWKNFLPELKKINALLVPNGLLIIRTSEKCWMFKLGLFIRKISGSEKILKKTVYDHFSVIPLKSLKEFLKSSGYTITEISSVKSIPLQHISFTARIQYLLGEFFYKMFRISFSAGFLICAVKTAELKNE
jgi:2-polyprenyl-3-methyl-5-hydroxy-6-metoxy-1,4-benzoquinol methylase